MTVNVVAPRRRLIALAVAALWLGFLLLAGAGVAPSHVPTAFGAPAVPGLTLPMSDTTPPAAPLNIQVDPAGWTRINSFNFTWTNPNDASGIDGVFYKLDSAPTGPTDGTFIAGTDIQSVALSFSGLSQGLHTVYFWLRDAAGNVDHTATATVGIRYDVSAPSVPASPQGSPTNWTNQNNFTITVTQGSDALSGLGGTWYKITRGVLSGNAPQSPTDGSFVTRTAELPDQLHVIEGVRVPSEGRWAAWVWLQDRAGNANHNNNNKTDGLFQLDQTPPTITFGEISGRVGNQGWYRSAVTVTVRAADQTNLSDRINAIATRLNNGAWITQTLNSPLGTATRSITADGRHTVGARASDGANNLSPRITTTIDIDMTPPSTNIVLAGTVGDNGWYTSTVVGTIFVNDALSGPEAAFWQLNGGPIQAGNTVTVSANGLHSLSAFGQDVAGNVGVPITESFQIDSVPPTVTVSLDGRMGTNGWFLNAPVTVTLTPSDNRSGVVRTFYRVGGMGNYTAGAAGTQQTRFVVNASDGEQVVYFYATDLAGNRLSTPLSVTIKIDSVPPAAIPFLPSAPVGWSKTNAFTATWSSNPPDTSGVAGAYYKIGSPPTSNNDYTDRRSDPYAIRNVTVPTQGEHDVYIWLYDQAGNSDYRTSRLVRSFRLDQTHPTTIHSPIDGTRIYTTAQTVYFTATDQPNLSGLKEIWYQVAGGTIGSGPWQKGTQVTVNQDGRFTISYYAVDNAGNTEPIQRNITVRVDTNAPAAPINLTLTGREVWQRDRTFCYVVTWTKPYEPFDFQSSFYRIGDAPRTNADGVELPGRTDRIDCLANVPEGIHDLHVWLRDRAGHADPGHRATLPRAIWWDPNPPTTTLSVGQPQGQNSWYTATVSINFTAVDGAGSGVASTAFRLDDGPWQSGNSLMVNTQGTHSVTYTTRDIAGNVEVTRTRQIKLDTLAPAANILPLAEVQAATSFLVRWAGDDGGNGSGIASYDVQVKDGTGPWSAWQSGTTATQATFQGTRGHVYYFRVRARDAAGWVGRYQTDTNTALYAFIQPIENGDFARTPGLSGWSTGSSRLDVSAVTFANHEGRASAMALLGNPSYPDRPKQNPNDPGPEPQVPVGPGQVVQTIRVPSESELPGTARFILSFRYNIWTCDAMVDRQGRAVDTFDVTLNIEGESSSRLVLRDGNPDRTRICDPNAQNPLQTAQNLRWKSATVDLTPFRGKTITLTFATWNRIDSMLNTWTYLDDVIVNSTLPCRTCLGNVIYLPLITRATSAPRQLNVQLNLEPDRFPLPPTVPVIVPAQGTARPPIR